VEVVVAVVVVAVVVVAVVGGKRVGGRGSRVSDARRRRGKVVGVKDFAVPGQKVVVVHVDDAFISSFAVAHGLLGFLAVHAEHLAHRAKGVIAASLLAGDERVLSVAVLVLAVVRSSSYNFSLNLSLNSNLSLSLNFGTDLLLKHNIVFAFGI